MRYFKLIYCFFLVCSLSACHYWHDGWRGSETRYQNAKAGTVLVIPPGLSADKLNSAYAIPQIPVNGKISPSLKPPV
jgi:uncharacterized lipoprotein